MITTAVILAFAIGGGAFIISSSRLSFPLRLWLVKRPGWSKVSEGINCPFCVSVWLSLAATAIYRPWLVSHQPSHGGYILSFIVTALAISAASMLPVLIINHARPGIKVGRGKETDAADT
jgi:hypothetical protein